VKLSALITPADLQVPAQCLPEGLAGLDITSVTCDSRTVEPGSLFLAVKGYTTDGHAYLSQAFEKGAAAVVAEHIPDGIDLDNHEKIILVKNSRKTTAMAAARFYDFPSRDLTLVGVTGTNGKTTITWILESIFRTCGFSTGVIGTVNIRYPGVSRDNPVTTPDPVSLQKTLREMKNAGTSHVIMEVSSHSLDQFRVEGCTFDACIYTNLSQDHLDYHNSLEDYFSCKQRLFTDFIGPGSPSPYAPAIINMDDEFGKRLSETVAAEKILVSRTGKADLSARDIADTISGLSFTLDYRGTSLAVSSGLTGGFNLENILCAAGAAFGLGIAPERIAQGIAALERVPGRLEKLSVPLNRHIFVDYAHTPGALDSILGVLASRVPARLITVFGCGGDRDTTKRGPMGLAACRHSDIAIVTSDNPRSEAPEAIVQDIVRELEKAGIPRLTADTLQPGTRGYLVEVGREKALNLALDISAPGDTIVAAGKGHETYQITNSGTIHFDDAEKLTEACQRLLTPAPWSSEDLARALDTEPRVPGQTEGLRFTAIGTDSRTMETNMVFVALQGESFDGHAFVPDLVSRGVRAFVLKQGAFDSLDPAVRNQMVNEKALVFETRDTLAAFGQLARYHRVRSQAKIAAITGSNGKTTTRKMAHGIFSTRFDTLATRGNFNNEIGLPLTLLRLAPVHQWAIVEMGMNHPGEISRLSAIARPDIAVITNTAGAHLEGLGTADNVARAKSEIFEGVAEGGTAVIFSDDPRRDIMEAAARGNKKINEILLFGSAPDARVSAKDIAVTGQGLAFTLTQETETCSCRINTPARFMVNNALAAAAASRAAGIPLQKIQEGLTDFTPVKGRMNLGTLPFGLNLIDDTYNANPASMSQALKTLAEVAAVGRAYAALGDMLELGPDSDRLHREIGHLAAELSPARLYLFGTRTDHLMAGAVEKGYPEARIFKGTKEEIAKDLAATLANTTFSGDSRTNPWLLLKGSRGMAMETLVPMLEAQYQRLTEEKAC
jgi:murE/murF fusion protein